jgi:hypothetical protein
MLVAHDSMEESDMDTNVLRWVVMRGPAGLDYQVFSGPWSRLEIQDIPEQQKMGYETLAVVDTEEEAWKWVELHRQRA